MGNNDLGGRERQVQIIDDRSNTRQVHTAEKRVRSRSAQDKSRLLKIQKLK